MPSLVGSEMCIRDRSQVQVATADRGTGFWDHQERLGISTVSAAGSAESAVGMAVGMPGLQPQTVASDRRGLENGRSRVRSGEQTLRTGKTKRPFHWFALGALAWAGKIRRFRFRRAVV